MDVIFEQTLKHQEHIALPAEWALHALPTSTALYHTKHRLRHPLGIYNTSIQAIAHRLLRVLDSLTGARSSWKPIEVPAPECDHLLENYDSLLDSLFEHMDDALSTLLSFFPDASTRNKHAAVKEYRTSVDKYRQHIGHVVNFIKHNQGRLRLVVFRCAHQKVLGYYVESRPIQKLGRGRSPTLFGVKTTITQLGCSS